MGDDERRPPLQEDGEPLLDERLRLGVEARRRLVEDEDPRVGQERAGDRDALPLPARELHARARRRPCRSPSRTPRRTRRPGRSGRPRGPPPWRRGARRRRSRGSSRRRGTTPAGRRRAAIRKVSRRTVERSTPSTRTRPDAGDVERRDEADDRRLARARRTDERRHRSRLGPEGDAVEDLLALLVGEADVLEDDLAAQRRPSATTRRGSASSGRLREDLLRPLEPGERLGQLRADPDDLEDGRHQEPEEDGVGEEAADGERPGEDLPRPDPHDDAPTPPRSTVEATAEQRHPGDRLQDVREEPRDAVGEDRLLAPLAVVSLDDADPGERLGEPPRDLAVDLRPLAKDGPRTPKNATRPAAKTARKSAVRPVRTGLSVSMMASAKAAVTRPPTSSTMPVPTRFRIPSTSFMTRETRFPVFWPSK